MRSRRVIDAWFVLPVRGMEPSRTPPPDLQTANEKLYQMRAQLRTRRTHPEACAASAMPWCTDAAGNERAAAEGLAALAALPPHVGWGSARLAATVRAAATRRQTPPQGRSGVGDGLAPPALAAPAPACDLPAVQRAAARPEPLHSQGSVKLYPDIGVGMLRQEQAAAGRIWLLARYLDREGRGWLRIANLRHTLTHKKSALRTCGWRQLRNLLRQGEGIFWARDKDRVWLRSAAKVAAALGVSGLTGRPVAVPVQALTESIGTVRAHLYAGFHSGREREERYKPIARDTLAQLTGVGRRSQIIYEQEAGIDVQHNFAVGEPVTAEAAVQERAWRNGQATFVLYDDKGQQGRPGREYVAWQLPNTYGGCHQRCRKGKQQQINRELAGLVEKGGPGNGEETIEKRYFPNGKLAAAAATRHPGRDIYWRRRRVRSGRYDVWQIL